MTPPLALTARPALLLRPIAPPYARQAQDAYEARVAASEARQAALDALVAEFEHEFCHKAMSASTELTSARTCFAIDPATGRHRAAGTRASTLGELVYETAECVDSAWDEIFGVLQRQTRAADPAARAVLRTLARQYAQHTLQGSPCANSGT